MDTYLLLDASFFRMHPGSPAEPVLAAWGITTDGKPAPSPDITMAPCATGAACGETACRRGAEPAHPVAGQRRDRGRRIATNGCRFS